MHRQHGGARRPHGARCALLALLLLAAATLSACDLAADPGAVQTAGPNLGLLSLPAYSDPGYSSGNSATGTSDNLLVDLWLDGTQNMGGVNPNTQSMYPHYGNKYREGGFHYHYGAQAGWYESLLGDFLSAAGDTRVRVLRYGNEAMPEAALAENGLAAAGDAARASVLRDLHTVAQAADAGLFRQMADEDMSGSFYALGSPAWLNRLDALNTAALENPSLAGGMAAALAAQAAGLAEGDSRYLLDAGVNEEQCALYVALQNIDTRKLSVITADPASVRKMVGADENGAAVAYYEQLLRSAGIFDRGLCVGVLDFQLDYLGQMATFTTATLSEPLVWGRVIQDDKKTDKYLGVMPRRMLTLVIGSRARVDGFIQKLSQLIDADRGLQGLRGPQNGELTYTAGGQTITQQPFTFTWNHTLIARPGMGLYTEQTEGAALAPEAQAAQAQPTAASAADALATDAQATPPDTQATDAQATDAQATSPDTQATDAQATDTSPAAMQPSAAPADYASQALSVDGAVTVGTAASGLPLIRLSPTSGGAQPDRSFTVRFPLAAGADGAALDVSHLTGARVTPLASLLLAETQPNRLGSIAAKAGEQVLTYREWRYVFREGMEATPFTLTGIAGEGDSLVCTVAVSGAALKPGYYRLRLDADLTGEQVAWEPVPWIDGAQSVSVSVTDAQVYAWEAFTAAMTQFDRDSKGLPRMFQHAWGSYTDKPYHGLRVPDFPPVYRSVRLAELVAQIRAAASSDVSPLVRYAFEVFVPFP